MRILKSRVGVQNVVRHVIGLGVMLFPCLTLWSVVAGESTSVVINEIAYRGTTAASTDEWIELYNVSSETIDLAGWQLLINTNTLHLSGSLPPHGYFLLERGDDQTISDQTADQLLSISLNDSGALLQLKNPNGMTVDQVSSWYVNLSSPPVGFSNRSSMERISPYLSGDVPINWRINNQQVRHGADANMNPVFGTPRFHNSQTIHAFGYGYEFIRALPIPIAPVNQQVVINELEILPVSGQKEWVELLNTTDEWLDLSTCSLFDSAAAIFSFSSSNSLLPGEILVVDLPSAKLGDNGDLVELRCGERVIDQVEYGSTSTGTPYLSLEGYSEELHYLPSPNGFNTLGRSPNGNTLWFLMSHEDFPTKGLANPDLRPVEGVSDATFIAGTNSVRLHWMNPENTSNKGTKIFLQTSIAEGFVLHSTLSKEIQTVLMTDLPNERVEFRIAAFNDSGKEAEGLDVAHLVVHLQGVTISEVLPDPKSGLEFIEFHNASTVEVDFQGYELSVTNSSSDLNDPSGTFEFADFRLAPGEYFAFFIDPDLHVFRLSNEQALVTLSDPEGLAVSEVGYVFPSRGVSIAYDDQLEVSLFHPTPNQENVFQNEAPRAVLTVQGTGSIQGCTVLNFNPTAANSFDPDDDELVFQWVYRTTDGQVLYTSSEENPLSFKFTEDMGEFFTVRLVVLDPFGANAVVTIPLELGICNGGKRVANGVSISPSSSTTLLINEVFPNPEGNDTGTEFVELYNYGPSTVQLNGWKLGAKTKKKLDGNMILPGQYFVFTEATLLNSVNTIQLLDPSAAVVSEVSYPDPEEGQSYSRDDQGSFRWTIPTPGTKNDFPFTKESVYLQGTAPIIIHRILPNPSGTDDGREWIELKNRSTDEIDLTGWKIDNREGGSLPYAITGPHLKPGQIQRFMSQQTSIVLRNTADQVRIFDASGALVDILEWKTDVGSDVILSREELSLTEEIKPDQAIVVKVVDGDTIDVRIESELRQPKVERVRLIGVDTPETVHPFKPVEQYGKEASNYTKSRLQGKQVRLEYDLSKRDKYGRILAYVYIDGVHFNAELVEKGYAFAYLRFPFRYREEFRKLELQAKQAGAGMWKNAEVERIQKEQLDFVDEELEAMEIFEEILEELEAEEKSEDVTEEKEVEYDQSGWEGVRLNEMMPNPKGKDEGQEYLELLNQGDKEVSLSDWKIFNDKNKILATFGASERLEPKSVMLLSELQSTLKNEKEKIQLVDPLGNIRDEFSYAQSMKDDAVWSRSPLTLAWQLLRKGTPGEANEIVLFAEVDADLDGIADEDERLLGLDPSSCDSDNNGYPDDFELLFRDQARDDWPSRYEEYLTESFRLEMKQTARTLTFFGTSRPYTTVELTVYSTPQSVRIPVEKDGSWGYKVELGLEKGLHHVEAFAKDPFGKQSIKTPQIAFSLATRMNVSKLPKSSKPPAKKATKRKPLYQIVEQPIHFYDGEIASWDPGNGLLILNDGRALQLPGAKRELGNIFLRIGERIRYSLEQDEITVKNLELVPSSFAAEDDVLHRGPNEPLLLFLVFLASLGSCFYVGSRRSQRAS